MASLPVSIQNLIDQFNKLPGIGPKTAARLTFHMLRNNDLYSHNLAQALMQLKQKIVFCRSCHNISESDICSICSDPNRNQKMICVVSEPLDVLALDAVGEYRGVYHVLHGEISPLDDVSPQDLKITELEQRIKDLLNSSEQMGSQIEVILATNPTMEGETTALYIHKVLQPHKIEITRIARGLPVGGDLEYADSVTLLNALSNRKSFDS